jgi:hypothetical protein
VKTGALVVEHHVVCARHAHDVVHARRAQQGQQRIHIVLVGLGVVGIADIAAHGQAEQFAAEMIFEAGAGDLFAVVQVLGPDEAHHRVHQHGSELARDAVGACFEGLLVNAVMRIGRQRRTLAGLEVHDVIAGQAIRTHRAAL